VLSPGDTTRVWATFHRLLAALRKQTLATVANVEVTCISGWRISHLRIRCTGHSANSRFSHKISMPLIHGPWLIAANASRRRKRTRIVAAARVIGSRTASVATAAVMLPVDSVSRHLRCAVCFQSPRPTLLAFRPLGNIYRSGRTAKVLI